MLRSWQIMQGDSGCVTHAHPDSYHLSIMQLQDGCPFLWSTAALQQQLQEVPTQTYQDEARSGSRHGDQLSVRKQKRPPQQKEFPDEWNSK